MSRCKAPRRLRCLLIALSLLAAWFPATSAFAEREAGSFGGEGGAAFHGSCANAVGATPEPRALTGVMLFAGAAVDVISMIDCGTLNANGTVTDGTYAWVNAGGKGGEVIHPQCPPNALVTGMKVWMDYNKMVNGFILRCTSMVDGTRTWTTMRTNNQFFDSPQTFVCTKNEIGVGLYGRAGSLVDKIGLLCADNPLKVASAPPPPPPCPEGQIRLKGVCQAPPLLQGTQTGSGGGFIQMIPQCPDGQTYDTAARVCVAVPGPAAPVGPVAAGAGEPAAGGGVAGTGGGMGAPSADCPAGTATVSTPAGLDFLNVRSGPSSGAQVVAQVPNGSQVTVSGSCFNPAKGAGFAKQTLAPKQGGGGGAPAAGGSWCRIAAPDQGCVSAQFLVFAGDGGGAAEGVPIDPAKGAGFAAQKPRAQVGGAGFGGRWKADADGTGYRLFLTQNGTAVGGTFNGDDGSAGEFFNGKLSGNVLRFSWKQADGQTGSGKFVLAADGRSFSGTYNFQVGNFDKVEGQWSGRRE